MSWGIILDIENRDLTDESEKRILDLADNESTTDEVKEQAGVALLVVSQSILSGALGAPDGKYRVTISGHANPGHNPTPGWSNDALTISISQR